MSRREWAGPRGATVQALRDRGRGTLLRASLAHQQANHAEVIPDWLVDKFAIAGTVAECRTQIERIRKSGIQQISIIPYSPPGGSLEESIRGFAKAMS